MQTADQEYHVKLTASPTFLDSVKNFQFGKPESLASPYSYI